MSEQQGRDVDRHDQLGPDAGERPGQHFSVRGPWAPPGPARFGLRRTAPHGAASRGPAPHAPSPYGPWPYGPGPLRPGLDGVPSGFPPAQAAQRSPHRSGGGRLIAAAGLVGALVLTLGGGAIAVGELRDLLQSTARVEAQDGGVSTGQRPGWHRDIVEAHDGVQVDWSAPAHSGAALDEGLPVDEAPGILMVESQVGMGVGTGTGMVLSADGLAITNYHVVADSTTVRVSVADTGEVFEAEVLGRDATHDIAVLRLQDASGLQTASLAEDPPSRGDAVAAVGNGSGQGYLTAVRGEVLGTDESILAGDEQQRDLSHLKGLFRTDADVVPGYSGGPLVNADGQVVGVTVAASDGRTSRAVDGYAIPLQDAIDVVDQVLSGEETEDVSIGADGALGIQIIQDDEPTGVRVEGVEPGSAADDIGLERGDRITEIDGESVGNSMNVLSRRINDRNVGEQVEVTWITPDGEEREETATLQEAVVN